MPEGYDGADAEGRSRFSIATYRNGGRDTLVNWMFGAPGKDLITMRRGTTTLSTLRKKPNFIGVFA